MASSIGSRENIFQDQKVEVDSDISTKSRQDGKAECPTSFKPCMHRERLSNNVLG